MPTDRLQSALLLAVSPRLSLRLARASRNLRKSESPEHVLALLELSEKLRTAPVESDRHDPIDETLRTIARIRQARADRIHHRLAGVYTHLPEQSRAAVRKHVGPGLTSLVGVLATDSSPDVRRSAIELATDANEPSLLPGVLPLIEDRDETVANQAASAVLALARALAEQRIAGSPVTARQAGTILAVLRAAERYPEHRSGPVMEAAILLLDPAVRRGLVDTDLARWMKNADEAVRMGLRAALKRVPGPAGRLRAWELLTEGEFRKSAIERLCAPGSMSEMNAVLTNAHLGLRPARRVPIRARVTRAERPRLFPDLEQIEAAPVSARRGLPLWLDAIGPEPAHIDGLLEPTLADEDDPARLAAVRRAPATLLRDFALDPSEPVARSAALRLLHSGALTDDFRATLGRSIHPSVRTIVAERPRHQRQLVETMRSVSTDRDKTIARLRAGLDSQQEREVLGAIRVIRQMNLAQELAPDLIRTIEQAFRRDDSPAWRIISAVLTAIPQLAHPSVAKLLAAARSHHDARIRATAVEAEPKRPRGRASSMVEVIKPAIDDPNHRVQTSALRVLLKDQTAPADTVDRVLGTLADENQAARAAALWLVERSIAELRPVAGRRWTDLAARVAELARTGEEQAERSRATRTARRMLAEIKG
ncbi:MAG: hypothetical protein KDA31_12575 [Phycisphaerales bacterium]|nr:hypothetical protein [Phycisphaerales bacterium]MCB9836714.1 hypothetical protein [Phycisphaera sp.]